MVEVFAGHCVALVAGLDLVFGEFFAASFDVAVFGSWQAASAIGDFAPYPLNPVRVGDVASTYGTVHAARSNKLSVKRFLRHG